MADRRELSRTARRRAAARRRGSSLISDYDSVSDWVYRSRRKEKRPPTKYARHRAGLAGWRKSKSVGGTGGASGRPYKRTWDFFSIEDLQRSRSGDSRRKSTLLAIPEEEWQAMHPDDRRVWMMNPGDIAAEITYRREAAEAATSGIDVPGGGGRGRGRRGGGGAGPKYVKPDEDQVRDYVKNYVVAVTGTLHEDIIEQGVKEFMRADKEGFRKRETEQVDPMTAVKKLVRGTSAYKAVNDLRPESVDEMQWVTGMQGKLRGLGISAASAEDLGIAQAGVGASDDSLRQAGEMRQLGNTGRLLQSQRAGLQRSATAVARLVRG